MGVAGALSGEYGADGLGFEDEESSMSVSEFKYAVYSGLSEYIEVDEDQCVFLDEGEYVFRSILKCFYVVLFISVFVLILYFCFSISSHSVSKLSSFQHSVSKSKFSFSRIFEKVTF